MSSKRLSHVDTPEAVGRRLRTARDRAGLSQRALAFPGCSAAYISRLEAGDRSPSLQVLRELARRLGVSEQHLATGRGRAERQDAASILVQADVALRLDDLGEASRLYERVFAEAPTHDDRAAALIGLGQLAFRRGEPREAIANLEQALQIYNGAVDEHPALADTLGRAYATVGQLDTAIAIFEKCVNATNDRNDVTGWVRFSVLLANALIDSGNFGAAAEGLGHVLARADELGDPLLRARIYWSQSRLYAVKHDAVTASGYARKALEILELAENVHDLARAHQLLAFIELERGEAEEALRLLQRGRELLAGHGSRLEETKFKLEETRALAAVGRPEEAAALAMNVAATLRDADPHDAGRGYTVLADVFHQLGEHERARELCELAIEVLEEGANPYLSVAYSKLANLLEEEGRTDEAFAALKKAFRAQQNNGCRRALAADAS